MTSDRGTAEPVLLVGYNRPGKLLQLIESLRAVQPPKVYLAIDGPRLDRPEDAARVRECQQLVAAVDWTTDVHTLFRAHNLGCAVGVSTAITWFFQAEERGAILEDDVIPTPGFFSFASTMLDRYGDRPEILAVSGNSNVPMSHLKPGSSRLSRYPYVWGWATWRDRWANYRLDMTDWRSELPISVLYERTGYSVRATLHWMQAFDACADGRLDSWATPLVRQALQQQRFTVVSNVNVTENCGFDSNATHTNRRPRYAFQRAHNRWSEGPGESAPQLDRRADRWVIRNQMGATVPRLLVRQWGR